MAFGRCTLLIAASVISYVFLAVFQLVWRCREGKTHLLLRC